MSEHQQQSHRAGRDDALDTVSQTQHTNTQDEGFDALLDEIDGLLEDNAAEYVRSFVQKGGQ